MGYETDEFRRAYYTIAKLYGNKTAKRSEVPLMNHINEGLTILKHQNADLLTQAAFCLHPIFQTDTNLLVNRRDLFEFDSFTIALVMEYRHIANASLSDIVVRENYDGAMGWDSSWEIKLSRSIKLSPLFQVNQMLIADKVQNRKDFILHHKGKHDRSRELDFYFEEWLKVLNVSDEKYREYVRLLDKVSPTED